MKQLILLIAIVVGITASIYAGPVGGSSLEPYRDVVLLGNDTLSISNVVISTQPLALATVVSARPARAYFDIINISGDTVQVGVSNSTQTAGLFSLATGKAISDVCPAFTGYTGIIYGYGTATSTIKVIELY